MFEFFSKIENKKAFKRALKEVNEEEHIVEAPKQKDTAHTKNRSVNRVYGSQASVEKTQGGTYKMSGALRKPETTAVDLKNFKDWRKIDKKEPAKSGPRFSSDPFKKTSATEPTAPFDEKFRFSKSPVDEEEEPSLDIDNPAVKKSPATTSATQKSDFLKAFLDSNDKRNAQSNVEEKKASPISFKELLERVAPGEHEKILKKRQEQRMAETARIKEFEESKKEVDLSSLTDTAKTEALKTEILKKSEPTTNKVKVEVMDFSKPKAEPAPVKTEAKPAPKKAPARKPRGKSKKRFDADVIGSVDWK